MKSQRSALPALPTLSLMLVALACTFTLPAHAVGRLADVTVVDRDSGTRLPVHYHRGEYWVAGQPGARYAIAVKNRLGARIMAVASVDGVNVLSGETAAWDQTGYVSSARESYQITGWRKSHSEVAAFEFSSVAESYAARTGRPTEVGVIGVALFRESLPEPVAQTQAPWFERRERQADRSASIRNAPPMPAPSTVPSAETKSRAAESADARSSSSEAPAAADSVTRAPAKPGAKLGTAHGARETSIVSTTSFERLQAQPNEIIRIRYDSRANLVAAGVIREPVAYPLLPSPNAFPQSGNASYVPDPY